MSVISNYPSIAFVPTLSPIYEESVTLPLDCKPLTDWTQVPIYGHQISLIPIIDYDSEDFRATCTSILDDYDVDLQELVYWWYIDLCQYEGWRCWSICDYNNNSIGMIEIKPKTLHQLIEEFNDTELAHKLFSEGKCFEIGYVLNKESRGMGIGTEMLKAFVDHAKQYGQADHLFAIVEKDNLASIRILEKTGFVNRNQFFYPVTPTISYIYTLNESKL